MGRESQARLCYQGQDGSGKLLLESTELILRGEVRARIPRHQITGFAAVADDLVIQSVLGPIRATLGAHEAALWVHALARPVPSLAAKLGVSPEKPAQVLGTLTDAALIDALNGCTSTNAPVLIAELADAATLDAAVMTLGQAPFTTFWGVTIKGKASNLPESTLRTRLRAAGFIDTKSCSVSETRTATRFHRR